MGPGVVFFVVAVQKPQEFELAALSFLNYVAQTAVLDALDKSNQSVLLLDYLHITLFLPVDVFPELSDLLSNQVDHFCMLLLQHPGNVLVFVRKHPDQLLVLAGESLQQALVKYAYYVGSCLVVPLLPRLIGVALPQLSLLLSFVLLFLHYLAYLPELGPIDTE